MVAELVFGEPIRLPGEFLTPAPETDNSPEFISRLRRHMTALKPQQVVRHGSRKTFVFKDLATCSHVFVRAEGSKRPLQQPYEGPHRVLARHEKFYTLSIRGREVTVSIDRLKPAYIQIEDNEEQQAATPQQEPSLPSTREPEEQRTRPVRQVRFTDRYQAGFG
ncbi:hypothetical protein NQ315_017438 [Exocentrus adspersus]|uniref:Uncharacterized protein n=1 Tax=Exocentrus adspersus TaxID=1586481 RepID=A0AAV8VKG5_9CUCU|nr:hypothetical protein NQ315_017438 [Exocentrus adspersus]